MGCGSSTSTENASTAVVSNQPTSHNVPVLQNTAISGDEPPPSNLQAHVHPIPQSNKTNVTAESKALPSLDKQDSNDTLNYVPLVSPFNVKSSVEFPQSTVEEKEADAGSNTVVARNSNGVLVDIKKELISKKVSSDVPVTNLNNDIMSPSAVGQVSAQNTDVESNVRKFYRYLKQSCKLTHNERLLELAPFVYALALDRSFYSFTKNDLLCKAVALMKHLHTLKLGGGQMGPIAFRFVATSLRQNTTIKNLDLSDNLANPECSAAIGSLLSTNSTLEILNLSGNRLGKDSLSRHVGSAMLVNRSLKSLDINNCGATDLHCLCESIRNSSHSCLVTLKVADNTISDDHQFVVDISLILESRNCKLSNIDISNTSISSSAMNIIIEAISKNTSICVLYLGKNAVSSTKDLCMMLMNVCTHPHMTVFSMVKTKVDDPTPCDFTECRNHEEHNISNSQLCHMDIADCSVDSSLLQYLASQLNGKLTNLEFLDVSKNEIGPDGLHAFEQLTRGQLKELKVSQIQNSNGIVDIIISRFTKLRHLDLTRTKLSQDDTRRLLHHFQNETALLLNGSKLGGLAIFTGLFNMGASVHLTELHLSVCQLTDDDINPICDILGQKAISFPLKALNVSVNRLTSSFIHNLVQSLLNHPQHDLQSINASNNLMNGLCLESLLKLFISATHSSGINSVNLSHNDITATDVLRFLSGITDRVFPLQNLDLSNQNESFVESDMEELVELIKKMFQDTGHNMWSDSDFIIDLRGNGGSEISNLSLVDSAAIKTDFVMKRKPELTLWDLTQIMNGIQFQNREGALPLTYSISAESWKEVILVDAPVWVMVNLELSKAAYISHMPSTATSQRIQGMLEMDADCDVKDLFLVKDPITQQSTGSAWVLFQDSQSANQAIDWFYNGNAYIFGNQFSITAIPLCITDESDNALEAANKDLEIRNLKAKQQLEMDKKVLEESEQLAAERAEYRELHPAYQGGRIS